MHKHTTTAKTTTKFVRFSHSFREKNMQPRNKIRQNAINEHNHKFPLRLAVVQEKAPETTNAGWWVLVGRQAGGTTRHQHTQAPLTCIARSARCVHYKQRQLVLQNIWSYTPQ